MAHKNVEAGRKMAELRAARGLRMRDVFELSEEITSFQGTSAFLIPPSRLSDIEARGVTPSIHRLYVLSLIYDCSIWKLLEFYGMDRTAFPLLHEQIRVMATKRRRMRPRTYRKLAPETRAHIERLLFETRLTQSEIAASCGVAQSQVCTIAREIGFGPRMRRSEREPRAQSRRNREIIRFVQKGWTYKEIGERYGITKQRAQQITKLYGNKFSRLKYRLSS